MGCILTTSKDDKGRKKKQGQIEEIVVFVPGFRIPKSIDFGRLLHGYLSASMVEQLSALRTRIVVMAAEECQSAVKAKKTATQHGGSTFSDLQQALEDYLPSLLGLTTKGSQRKDLIEYIWINQEDEKKETALANSWYEVLSVLHMMAMLCLSEANLLLISKASAERYPPKVIEGLSVTNITKGNRKAAIDIFLKAAGFLECGVQYVLPQIPQEVKSKLPADLEEAVLQAFSGQALGQGVEIQLGLAIDNPKATLAVKRRLACEQVKYWCQAQESISNAHVGSFWGEKHVLFIRWKYAEAKAAAYYYHGLILDEGNEDNNHAKAVACLQVAEQYLEDSKRACSDFCVAVPVTRVPPLWGAMKFLSENIPKDASSKSRTYRDVYSHEKIAEALPNLPEFSVALKPDEYKLPPTDDSWNEAGKQFLPNSS